jgi:hypothetical protein
MEAEKVNIYVSTRHITKTPTPGRTKGIQMDSKCCINCYHFKPFSLKQDGMCEEITKWVFSEHSFCQVEADFYCKGFKESIQK